MKDWKEYWDAQTSPNHRHNTDEWFSLYAQEINLIVASLRCPKGPVLEIGCGNGAMFDEFNFVSNGYVGLDLSRNLTSQFQLRFPGVEVHQIDAVEFEPKGEFSLVFSNGVLQNVSPKRLQILVDKYLGVLGTQGVFLGCNIPWRKLRSSYFGGELSANSYRFFRSMRRNLLMSVREDSFGYWYNPRDFFKWKEQGFDVRVFGSLFYPYRFSIAILKV